MSQPQASTSYKQALAWLYKQTRAGAPRSLDRMQLLMDTLELASPASCIYVVGTNGKGSVANMIAEGLKEAGFKTGRFSSPHVSDFAERITVNQAFIDQGFVSSFVQKVQPLKLNPKPAFFEWTLALALQYFEACKVEIAVIEAGVGSKLDATQLIKSFELSVITNVALDHQNSLGSSLEAIAEDKAYAIRSGKAVITAAKAKPLAIIKEKAKRLNANCTVINEANHLLENQTLAKAALSHLGLSEAVQEKALHAPALPARLELFELKGYMILVDGAHNPHSAEALLKFIESSSFAKPYQLIFAAKRSKDAAATFKVLNAKARSYYLSSVLGHSTQLANYDYFGDPEAALQSALENEPKVVVVAGSFYLAAEIRDLLINKGATRVSYANTT